jgi:hypothetical protein
LAEIPTGQAHTSLLRLQVDPLYLADDQLRPSQHASQRHDDGAWIDQPARDLGQERLIQHEVLRVDERELLR